MHKAIKLLCVQHHFCRKEQHFCGIYFRNLKVKKKVNFSEEILTKIHQSEITNL